MYDIIIVGAGCAGLTAGIYASRAGLKTLIIEKVFPGGKMMLTQLVENYPGFPDGVQGPDLAMLFKDQAEKTGAVIEITQITKFDIEGAEKKVTVENNTYTSKVVVLAMGASNRQLGIESEAKFIGSGVSYCATCDGAFFKGKNVAVVGGGDSAIEDALYLTSLARKVYVIHRRDELRAQDTLQKVAMQSELIEFVWDSEVTEILGENAVSGIRVFNKKSSEEREIDLSGVFVAIGTEAHTAGLAKTLETDSLGYIIVDSNMRTNIPGVYAAGDIVSKPLKQVLTAAADGALAINNAQHYIQKELAQIF